MKLMIDANILIDVLQKREPHFRFSALIWKMCETKQAKGYVSALTFANLVYIMRKELTPEKTEEIISKLLLIFALTELNAADIQKAAKMRWNDFEDALQSVAAERVNADYIITRNTADFEESKVAAIPPSTFVSEFFSVVNM